jgi:hypothetical protein
MPLRIFISSHSISRVSYALVLQVSQPPLPGPALIAVRIFIGVLTFSTWIMSLII